MSKNGKSQSKVLMPNTLSIIGFSRRLSCLNIIFNIRYYIDSLMDPNNNW